MLDDSCSSEGRAHVPLNKLRTSHACFLSCHPSFCSWGSPLTCHCVRLLWTLTWDLPLHSCGGCSKTQVLAGGGSGALGDPSARVSGGCSVWWAGALTTLLHTHRGMSSVSHPCLWFQALFLAAASPSLAHQPLGLFHNNSIAFKNSSSSSSYQKHLLGPTRLSPGGQGGTEIQSFSESMVLTDITLASFPVSPPHSSKVD